MHSIDGFESRNRNLFNVFFNASMKSFTQLGTMAAEPAANLTESPKIELLLTSMRNLLLMRE